ncbi:hypothetical protein AVL48_36500 [Amycolatopsis regifaucium]|uniref:Uncharacterized protein n=1 Tax=Amycolatopsis regifaucium TaxID=546365 RepID=A0A154MF36_9PSEU|nr:hypothetical protein AVL48_36500 [Amycolatopsis regifaucium]OKA03224.1 hypothetical protein ATP06_0237500 [Amycolatopsis regifaucium]SFJ46619.1 hypothetical protein SAMN04489731_12220 [Amycolatopsis regifaucium]
MASRNKISLPKFLLISAPLLFVVIFLGFKFLFDDTAPSALLNSLIIVAIFTVLVAVIDLVRKKLNRTN